MHDEFYSLTGKLKNILKSLMWFFFCRGEGVATRRLPCLRYGSHYLEVEICHRWTLLSANPKFSGLGASFSSLGCSVFEIWVLRFRDLGASFSIFGCFVFDFWVLCFRVLGAPFSSLGCFVFENWVLSASVFVFGTT